MKCERCEKDVPDFLWTDMLDHPLLTNHPATIFKTDFPDSKDEYKITMHVYVQRMMCSEMYPTPTSILNLQVSVPIEEAMSLAIGAASMCWATVDNAGEFNSSRAEKIKDELVEYINWKQPIY